MSIQRRGPQPGIVRLTVAEILGDGPMPLRHVERELNRRGIRSSNLAVTMQNMITAGEARIVGTVGHCEPLRFPDVRPTAFVYGLKSCPLMPGFKLGAKPPSPPRLRPVRLPSSPSPRVRRRVRGAGSGVVAPPPFVTGYRW